MLTLFALSPLALMQEPEPQEPLEPTTILIEEGGEVVEEVVGDPDFDEILVEDGEPVFFSDEEGEGGILFLEPIQEPGQTDAEADALSAWLNDGAPGWDTPTGRFLRDLELGMSLDLIAEFTEKRDSVEEYNDLRVRSAQLNFASPVAGIGRAFFTLDFSDGGNGMDVVVREAGAQIDDILPMVPYGKMSLRVGKYAADLGAWNTVYANEFPAPSLDGTRRALFGGNLVLSGAELHHVVPHDFGTMRWSVGIGMDSESQDVDSFGNGLDTDAAIMPSGRRGPVNWAGTLRATSTFEHGSGMRSRIGVSGFYAPEEALFTLVGATTERAEVHHTMYGFDGGFLYEVPNSDQVHEVSFEIWVNDSEFRDGTGAYIADESRGEWAMYEFTYNPQWSIGGLFSRNDVLGLDALDLDASYHSGFLTYHFTPQNRVSIFLTHTNPRQIDEKFFTVGAQLTMDLGASRNNAIPRWN
ncbi:MAG: hypothetical protein ACPG31_06445 [Planctomycetota bacterium]